MRPAAAITLIQTRLLPPLKSAAYPERYPHQEEEGISQVLVEVRLREKLPEVVEPDKLQRGLPENIVQLKIPVGERHEKTYDERNQCEGHESEYVRREKDQPGQDLFYVSCLHPTSLRAVLTGVPGAYSPTPASLSRSIPVDL